MSVSHKIVNVSVSHKIVIYRVILRGLDRGGQTMVCNGPNWCLTDNMLRNNYQTLSNTAKKRHNKNIKYFVTYRHFLRDLQTLAKIIKLPIFLPKSVWTWIRFCLISVFLCTNHPIWKEKIHGMYFCSYSDFSVSLWSCGGKMSVGHANEYEIYILYIILVKITDYRFVYSYKSPAAHSIN